ncbi:MAG TPA: tetratricopeptide repeat protein [Candidatus Limnocylindrales bacterium]
MQPPTTPLIPASSDAAAVEPCWPGAVPDLPNAPLIGREADVATVRRLALGRDRTFITLAGIGGVGKSRLAVELTRRAMPRRDGRVAFVPLDGVSDPSLVLPAIAGAMGVAEEPGRLLVEILAETLGRAPAVLVLDTVEHVRAAAPALSDLLAATPGLTILATSRIAIGVPRERVVWVEPLPVPAADETELAVLTANPAVELFLARARISRPEIEPTPTNAALAATICRRLDGIPLAIELAAAALRVLAPHQLIDQLEDRLSDDPAAGTSSVGLGEDAGAERVAVGPARQRSLRAAMDWSIGLLPEPVLRLYRRASVISGTFGVPTAIAILDGGERRGLAPLGIDVAAGLQQLSAASLLRHEDDGLAFAMLTTVRADAQDRLARAGEAVAMRWAHAYQVLAVAEEAEQLLPTDREIEALDRLDEAHDDIREALEWSMDQGDGTFALRLAGALAEFWRTRGHHTEGRLRLAAALSMAVDPPPGVRRKALSGAGLLASFQGDYRLAEAYLRESLAIAREQGDVEAEAIVLNWLGTNAYGAGDLKAAEAFASESLAMRRRIGDPVGIALALNALGGVRHFRGDLDSAREMFIESLALKQAQPAVNANGIAVSLTNLGLVERDAGHPEAAEAAFKEALDIWERTGDKQRVSVGVHNAALLALDQGRLDEAAAMLTRAHDIARDIGDRTEVAYAMADLVRVDVERGDLDGATIALAIALPRAQAMSARIIVLLALEGAAGLAAARGDDALAIRLWAAAAADREVSGFANMPADQRLLDARMGEARERLDPETAAAAWADGQAMSVDAAIDAAMTLVGGGAPVRAG